MTNIPHSGSIRTVEHKVCILHCKSLRSVLLLLEPQPTLSSYAD